MNMDIAEIRNNTISVFVFGVTNITIKYTNKVIVVAIKLIRNISEKALSICSLLSLTFEISLIPYVVVPKVAKIKNQFEKDNEKPYFPRFSAPNTREM
jgi:hypothetical protein